MLKRSDKTAKNPIKKAQPPSGGCVLKHECPLDSQKFKNPAAFRRLCVETRNTLVVGGHEGPAAFRRLCVETPATTFPLIFWSNQPPSGGCVLKRLYRLQIALRSSQPPSGGCVLKLFVGRRLIDVCSSRLQAAVC